MLQEHLFGHLWLLDAAWERATGSQQMEEDLRALAPGIFATDASGNQIKGRLDIRYATAGGRHVIVELKRYRVKTDVGELAEQGLKYYNALRCGFRSKAITHSGRKRSPIPGFPITPARRPVVAPA